MSRKGCEIGQANMQPSAGRFEVVTIVAGFASSSWLCVHVERIGGRNWLLDEVKRWKSHTPNPCTAAKRRSAFVDVLSDCNE